jgi:hypothetical protein
MSALPKSVIDAMADRSVRMHHMLWHTSRQSWLQFTAAQRQVFRDHDWEPPRPARKADGSTDIENGSGEDFLYMHRQMIADVDQILAELNDPQNPRVEGWPSVPAPDDTDYPVPPPFEIPGNPRLSTSIRNAKNRQFSLIQDAERRFTDPQRLSGMPLGQLGAEIEFGIHGTMHLRWSAQMPEYRPGGNPSSSFDVAPKWNEPSYDWLADFYSSHVNPIFWKLHGWVDARIDDWMKANNHTGPVPWTFDPPWTGPMEPDHGHQHITGLALRARLGTVEESTLDSRVRALEATIDALKTAGVREPTPFVTID